jgi:hypothetical protein
MEASGVRIDHPNRDKPESKATKAAITLLLLTSAGLTAVITFGGWDAPLREPSPTSCSTR